MLLIVFHTVLLSAQHDKHKVVCQNLLLKEVIVHPIAVVAYTNEDKKEVAQNTEPPDKNCLYKDGLALFSFSLFFVDNEFPGFSY